VKHMRELKIYPNLVTLGLIVEGLNKAPNEDLPTGVKTLVTNMKMNFPVVAASESQNVQIRKMFEELCTLLPPSKWAKT